MTDLKIAIVYFSGTYVTHTCAQVIEEALRDKGCTVTPFNVTGNDSRIRFPPVDVFDGLVFGFPVYSDFAPTVVNEWLPTLEGKGKRCVMFFTYGARTTGFAHFHTALLLRQAGFRVLFSAEFPGRHTFNLSGWRILPDRPDERDFAVARDYAALCIERFTQDSPPDFKPQKPFGYCEVLELQKILGKREDDCWTNPVRTRAECSMCRNCETECPALAFNADSGISDPERCIGCMHCVYICPDKVIGMEGGIKVTHEEFLNFFHMTEEMISSRKSRIITEAGQIAF
jgi:Pyruvate/2-oxoacid:ferredoxin oxidoreductase delta subunit